MRENKIFQKNKELLLERYPKFLFFIKKNFLEKEKKVIDKGKKEFLKWKKSIKDIDEKDLIYVYGLDLENFFFLKRLLNEKKKRDIIFIEEDEKRFHSFLSSSIAEELLKNPKMHIFFKFPFEEDDLFFDSLGASFFAEKIEVLSSKEDSLRFCFVKDKITRAHIYFSAYYFDRLYSFHHFKNLISNFKHLPNSFFVNSIEKKFKNIPAVICGAGPSLDFSKDILKTIHNKALIFSVGSSISAFSSYNIIPHFGVVIDPNREEFLRMKSSFLSEFPIFYSSRVNLDVFKTFNGPYGYFRSSIGDSFASFIEKKLKIDENNLGEKISREAFSSTVMALDIANFLGCSPIVLCGVDLSFTENRRYSKKLKIFEDEEIIKENLIEVRDKDTNEKIYTKMQWIMEAKSISSYKEKFQNLKILNGTKKGLKIEKVEDIDLKEFANSLKEEIDLKGYVHRVISKSYFKNILQDDLESITTSLEKSFKRCKKSSLIITKEIKKLIKENKDILETPIMILEKRDIKKEISYKLIKNTIFSLEKYLQRHFNKFEKDFKKIDFLKKEYDKWQNLKKIINQHLKVFRH